MQVQFFITMLLSHPCANTDVRAPDVTTLAVTMEAEGIYRVEGHIWVQASIASAWQVLTDFDQMSRFVRHLKLCQVRHHQGNRLWVEQVAEVAFLVAKSDLHVVLDVRPTPPYRLDFVDTLGADWETYSGSWTMRAVAGGVEAVYRLVVKPRFWVPEILAIHPAQQAAEELLRDVASEIGRRATAPCP